MTPMPENLNPTPEELELDRRMQLLLSQALEQPPLPPDFAVRLAASRPFAPWEVRHARSWKAPFAVGSTLLAGSAGIALAPLWHLGPGTAVSVWGRVLLASVTQPLNAAFAAAPLLSEAVGKLATPAGVVTLGVGSLLAIGGVAYALRSRVAIRA
jgi:hypothetical protein